MIGVSLGPPCYTSGRLTLGTRTRIPRDPRRRLRALALSSVAIATLVALPAAADEPPAAPPTDTEAPDSNASNADEPEHIQDIDPDILAAERFRRVTLIGNPFGLMVGRVSPEVQLMMAPHHGLVFNPYIRVIDDFVLLTTSLRREFGYGAELGYRYFTGKRGANGLFIGPSVIAAHDHVAAGIDAHSLAVGPENPSYVGAILDAGAQGILDSGFTIGGGAGGGVVHRLGGSPAFTARLLFTLGYSF
jgi:hypothetical protein